MLLRLEGFSYGERLDKLSFFSLEQSGMKNDLIGIYKTIRDIEEIFTIGIKINEGIDLR